MKNKINKFLDIFHLDILWVRLALILFLFIVYVITVFVINIVDFDAAKRFSNFEFWGMFLLGISLIFFARHWSNFLSIRIIKLVSVFVIFAALEFLVLIALGITSLRPKFYTAFGIVLFALGWLIEIAIFYYDVYLREKLKHSHTKAIEASTIMFEKNNKSKKK